MKMEEESGQSRVIDIAAIAKDIDEPWTNVSLVKVDDSVVRMGVVEGEFHWHRHSREDEFFLVMEGRLLIDLEGEDTVELDPWQAYTVPKGRLHRTRAPVRTVILMVERAGVQPRGD